MAIADIVDYLTAKATSKRPYAAFLAPLSKGGMGIDSPDAPAK